MARLVETKKPPRRVALNLGSGSLRFGYQLGSHRAIYAALPAFGAYVFVNRRAGLLAAIAGHYAVFSGQTCPAAASIALPLAVNTRPGFDALDDRLLWAGGCGRDKC